MKLLLAPALPHDPALPLPDGVIAPSNDIDPRTLDLNGIARIDLNFPKFTDGRAFSQAFLLRRRLHFKGELRAVGEVLIDQLQQLQRTGFDSAQLRADQNLEAAQRQLGYFADFYQGDAVTTAPRFARLANAQTPTGPTANAIALYAKKSTTFEQKVQQTITFLQESVANYPSLIQASSLSAEDMVLTHLIEQAGHTTPLFVLETGRLHPETLALLASLKATMGERLQVLHPNTVAAQAFDQEHGPNAMRQSQTLRKTCCAIRKLEPLERALAGKNAWLTGLRREQSGHRAEVSLVDTSEKATTGRIKLNPLAAWTWSDIWYYIEQHKVPYNVLHDQFYPSIGCEPCTRAISVGEDFRSGRWWWEDAGAKECGLHTTPQ